MPRIPLRTIFLILLLILGGGLGAGLFLWESGVTEQFLTSNPGAYTLLHEIRPYLLLLAAFLPASLAIYYHLSGIIDRYIIRKFLGVFSITITGFTLIWFLLELQERPDIVTPAEIGWWKTSAYFLAQLPYILSLMMPFALLLASLFVLGQLSAHCEVIGIIQTGRSFFRIIIPLVTIACILSIFVGILSYHWSSWTMNYKEGMLDAAQHDTFTRAKNITFADHSSREVWYVGLFPKDYYKGEPLKGVEISHINQDNLIEKRLLIDEARWDKSKGHWNLKGVTKLTFWEQSAPTMEPKIAELSVTDWTVTPAMLLSAGLDASSLGVPELNDWLHQNKQAEKEQTLPYLTNLHYRFASPWTCLVAVLLAAPMGIVFSRRGAFGGVVSALALCLILFFMKEILVAMGENAVVPPFIAAWGTNIVFTVVAAVLIHRRLTGQSIYQNIKKVFTPH